MGIGMGMTGKMVRFALGTQEQLRSLNKILQKVDIYIDGESGTLYVVPQEKTNLDYRIGNAFEDYYLEELKNLCYNKNKE